MPNINAIISVGGHSIQHSTSKIEKAVKSTASDFSEEFEGGAEAFRNKILERSFSAFKDQCKGIGKVAGQDGEKYVLSRVV